MSELIALAYFGIGLFVSGAFVGEYAMDEGKEMDAKLALFMLVMGTLLWPATLGMRFYRRLLP